jgi:hypothetical protein
MKKLGVGLLAIVLAFSVPLKAQLADGGYGYFGPGQEGGMFMGGMGLSVIDDQTYFSINLRPEIAFGKIGIGLNINFLYDTKTGHIRSKDWDSSYDYLRLIRYLRYGYKWDPVYMRVGTLDAARLGHGLILNYYTNELNYDERKIGLAFDLDFGQFGFETITSNLGRAELVGMRAYYRPLVNIIDVPLVKNLAFGGTFVHDFDPDTWDATDDGVSALGLDVEMPLLNLGILNSKIYFDWAQLSGYSSLENKSRQFGSGTAAGIMVSLGKLVGLIDLSAKLERRWLGEEFSPSFFDPFYEIYRFRIESGEELHKTDTLIGLEKTKGIFGELYGGLMGNKVRLLGMYAKLDDVVKADDIDSPADKIRRGGMLHLSADAPDLIPTIAAHATYDKIGVEEVDDVFTLDNNSVARVGVGYKIKPYLILYMDYIWTFVETEPGSRIYKPQERIEPKLVFAYHF